MSHEAMDQIMILVVIPILSAVATFIITWFRARTEEIKKRMKAEETNHYVSLLNQTVDDVVNALNQTTVEELKKASEDGKLPREDAERIRDEALAKIMLILGDKGIFVLKQSSDNIECLICSKIEASVRRSKAEIKYLSN